MYVDVNTIVYLQISLSGTCDSFVRINLFPEDKFTGVTKPKTQTHNKTLFPLYEEKFVM